MHWRNVEFIALALMTQSFGEVFMSISTVNELRMGIHKLHYQKIALFYGEMFLHHIQRVFFCGCSREENKYLSLLQLTKRVRIVKSLSGKISGRKLKEH